MSWMSYYKTNTYVSTIQVKKQNFVSYLAATPLLSPNLKNLFPQK